MKHFFKENTALKWAIIVFAAACLVLVVICIIYFVGKGPSGGTIYEELAWQEDDDKDKSGEDDKTSVKKQEEAATALAEMTKWTIKDVGMSDGEYKEHQSSKTGQTLDKKAFTTYVVFPSGIDSSHSAELWIGEYGNGFVFQVKNEALSLWHYQSGQSPQVIKYITAKAAGVNAIFDEPMQLTLSTEFINNDGEKTDVKVGIYINGKLYADAFQNLRSVTVTSLKQEIYVFNKWAGGKTTWLGANPKPAEKSITDLSKLSKWTIEAVGLDTGEYEIKNGTSTGANLDKKAFACAVVFPKITEQGRDAQLWVGEQNNGFLFNVKAGKLQLTHLSSAGEKKLTEIEPAKVGLSSVLEEEIFIHLTTEFENNNGKTTNVNIALYINNKRYNDKYMKLEAVPLDSLKQQVCVYNRWSGGKVTWISPVLKKDIPPVTSPSQLTKWTIQTVGMANGDYGFINQTTGVSGTATGASLDKKAFYGKVTFPDGLTTSHAVELWIGEQNNGIHFDVKGEVMYLKHMVAGKDTVLATMDPAKVGLSSFLDRELELIVTVEFANNNGTTTDANIGVYFNGTLYNGAYFKLKAVPINSLMQQVVIHTRWGNGKKIHIEAN